MRHPLQTTMVALGASALFGGAASAVTWEMATPYPEGNFHTENINWFVEQVEERTDGELVINVHPGASMFEMSQIKRALRTQQVPIAEFFLSAFGNEDPIYEADSVPFLATGFDEARELFEITEPMLSERFDQEGITALFYVPWPGNGLYSAMEVTDVSDFEGLRIRGQTAIIARLAELLGGQPVDVQFVEVPQAFQTGVIEAMITSATTGVDTQSWDYVNYFYDVKAVTPKNVVAVNTEAWESLPESLRTTVTEVAAEAQERGWDRALELQEQAKGNLRENGMNVPEVTEDLQAEMAEIGQQMIDEWLEEAGEDGTEIARQMGKLEGGDAQ